MIPLLRRRRRVVTGEWRCPECHTKVTIETDASVDPSAAAAETAGFLDTVRDTHRCIR